MEKSDIILINEALAGSQGAFRTIVERHENRISAVVTGMLGPGTQVKDTVQNVFIRFFKSMADFRGEAKLETYLTRIAMNLSLNELKKRRKKNSRMVDLHGHNQIANLPDGSDLVNRLEARDAVWKGLQYLEEETRSVITLRLIQGYSTKETAEILDLPMGTVASRLARGQEKLKVILKKLLSDKIKDNY